MSLLVPLLLAMLGSAGGGRPPVSEVAASLDSIGGIFEVGEELTYNVSYAFVDIGQVRIKVLDKVTEGETTYVKTIAYIDSYKGIPFVDLHVIYESVIAPQLHSVRFRARNKIDKGWDYYLYSFDYPNNGVYIEHGLVEPGTVQDRDTLRLDTLFQDGLSLFYYARANVRSDRTVTVPTVVNQQTVSTVIQFNNERTGEKIDFIDYPVDVVHFEGKANFVGVFGLTGDFEGWFSNDEARVPILAKMKVIIGNIRVELMKWKRDGWTPPRFTDEDD